ncbi:hypothetical protein Ancab_012526 [Ancistrocladus abbreviatus]
MQQLSAKHNQQLSAKHNQQQGDKKLLICDHEKVYVEEVRLRFEVRDMDCKEIVHGVRQLIRHTTLRELEAEMKSYAAALENCGFLASFVT